MIANLELIKDKDDYAVDDDITVNVKFSLTGKVRDVFNEENWNIAYDKFESVQVKIWYKTCQRWYKKA